MRSACSRAVACRLILAGSLLCVAGPSFARRAERSPGDWRIAISEPDRKRLHDWRTAWTVALTAARSAGAGAAIDAEGALLQPDAAIDGAPPPDGEYRCRIVKVGARPPGGPPLLALPTTRCRISDGRFAKLEGVQRPTGRLYDYDGTREIMLGTMALGDEAGALPYGADAERDVVGLLERIGRQRWRLVLPQPHWESLLDVIDLVPAAP